MDDGDSDNGGIDDGGLTMADMNTFINEDINDKISLNISFKKIYN